MSNKITYGPAPLPIETTVADLQPGDKFAYSSRPGNGFRDSPVVSVENIGGTRTADGTSTYAEGMHRVRYENSDELGTLFYGNETVYRAKRAN